MPLSWADESYKPRLPLDHSNRAPEVQRLHPSPRIQNALNHCCRSTGLPAFVHLYSAAFSGAAGLETTYWQWPGPVTPSL